LTSFFKNNYQHLRYPISDGDDETALRRAQLGAIHSIPAHFTLKPDPAIIVMPTGSGKTAVLMMTVFALRAQRALVITPSVLVRNQVAEHFASLATLRSIKAITEECPNPKVYEIPGKLSEVADWEALRDFDVAVGTPKAETATLLSQPQLREYSVKTRQQA
jgi:hypothetical protein